MNLLIDLDGVLRFGNKTAEGVDDFLAFIAENNVNAAIISNSTLSNSDSIRSFFESHKTKIPFPIMTAADAAYNYSKENYSSVQSYCNEKVSEMFAEMENEINPDAVVIGDIGDKWNFRIMNEIFLHVKNGADLIAMQKNKFWKDSQKGFLLDVGPFVKAIEYAAGVEAKLIGKPSPLYFEAALKKIGSSLDEKFFMIGDDIETDIGGAQNCGGKGILIYTGKTKYPLDENNPFKPDFEVKDLYEAISLFKSFNIK